VIDKEIINIFNERIAIEINEQNNILRIEFDKIISEMSGRGILRSSVTIRRITDLCAIAIKFRAQLIWQTLFRCITTAGISYSSELPKELKTIASNNLPESMLDMNIFIQQAVKLTGFTRLSKRITNELCSARNQVLAKTYSEIELFVFALRKKEAVMTGDKPSTIFNIYSPVGSIQTGDNAFANNISQNVDSGIRDKILESLNEIQISINQPGVELSNPREELIDLIQESKDEIQQSKPNITRLKSLLTTIGTSIQVISSAKPAYDTLKQGLTFLGIYLP
jgi:hypothetical protein